MSAATKRYLLGMVNAFVSGAAASAGGIVVDPAQFNLSTLGGFKHMGILAGVSGFVSFVKWMVQHPIAEIIPIDTPK